LAEYTEESKHIISFHGDTAFRLGNTAQADKVEVKQASTSQREYNIDGYYLFWERLWSYGV